MLTKLKKKVQAALSAEARLAHRLGFTPNTISVSGIILSILAALAYSLAGIPPALYLLGAFIERSVWLVLAVVLLLASGFCDTLDGVLARTYQQTSVFGGFFDSLLDRYADAIIYSAIVIVGLCDLPFGLAALAGSLLVSYSRARAEAAGVKMESVGIAERAERMLILAAVSLVAILWLPALNWGILVIAVLSHFTVFQRGLHAYRWLKKNEKTYTA